MPHDANATPLWSRTPHPGYYINSVAVSDDGSLVAAGTFFHDYGSSSADKLALRAAAACPTEAVTGSSQDGRFGTYVWNRAGDCVLSQEFDGWQGVYWVDMAGDGSVVASCGWYSSSPDYLGFIAAYAVADGSPLLFFQPPARGNVVALDARGQLLLAGADQGYLFRRGAGAAFAPTPTTIPLSTAGDSALVTALDAAGRIGLVASYQGELVLFAIDHGVAASPQRWKLPNAAYLHFAALSADGAWAYAGANDGTLYALSVPAFLADPEAAWSVVLEDGAKTIYAVGCDGSGRTVAAAGNTIDAGSLSCYRNTGSGGQLSFSANTLRSPNSLSIDAGGRWLALADGHPDGTPGHYYLWDATSGVLQWQFTTSDMSWPIHLAADGSVVAAGSDNGEVYLFATGA